MTPLVWRKKTLFLHDFYVTRPLFWISTIAQESQQSASRGRVLAFYRIAPCLSFSQQQYKKFPGKIWSRDPSCKGPTVLA